MVTAYELERKTDIKHVKLHVETHYLSKAVPSLLILDIMCFKVVFSVYMLKAVSLVCNNGKKSGLERNRTAGAF